MRKVQLIFWVCYALFLILVAVVYVFIVREQVKALFLQEAHPIFQKVVYLIYPRLEVESQRFSPEFFLTKADQVIGRFLSLGFLVLTLKFILLKINYLQFIFYKRVKNNISRFQSLFLIRIYFVALLGFTWDWSYLFYQLYQIRVFYQPIFLLKILQLPFPNIYILWGLYGLMVVSCILVILQKRAFLFSIVSISLFIILQGYLISFHKIDHTYSTFIYAGILLPFLQLELSNSILKKKTKVAAWILVLIQSGITLPYFFAGLEKLLIAGLQWFNPENMRHHFQAHPTELGLYLSQSDTFCVILAILTIVFQLSFIFTIFFKKTRWIFIPSGILFHIGTYVLFHIGWYWSPWTFVYVFFINWDFLNKFLCKNKTS